MARIDMLQWVLSNKQVAEGRLPDENVLVEDKGSFTIGITEIYFVELFYDLFLRSKSEEYIDMLKKEVSQWSDPVAKTWALYAFDRFTAVVRYDNENFESEMQDITSRVGLPYSHVTAVFKPYMPFITSADAFRYAYENIDTHLFCYFYLLLIYFFEDDFPDPSPGFPESDELAKDRIDYQRGITESFLDLAPQYIRVKALPKLYEAFAMINKAGVFKTKLNLSYDKVLYGEGKPLTGEFYLRWDKVDFYDGFYMVRHPDVPFNKVKPYKIEDAYSRKVFNEISPLFMKSLTPLWVQAQDGQIVKVLNTADLSSCITLMEHKVNAPAKAQRKEPYALKKVRRELSSSEAKALCKDFKSRYLDYLCAKQLDAYKVICCIEQRINATGTMASEYSFIFTVKETRDKLYLAYENSFDSRCTYLFPILRSSWQRGIDKLYEYFASNEVNKRQSLASRLTELHMPGGFEYQRIFHKDYLGWVDKIKYCH